MTAKSGAEKEQKQAQNQQSLKGTLADVLARSAPPPAVNEQPKKTEQPVAVEPPRSERKHPFEVPEDALRKVLKGES